MRKSHNDKLNNGPKYLNKKQQNNNLMINFHKKYLLKN